MWDPAALHTDLSPAMEAPQWGPSTGPSPPDPSSPVLWATLRQPRPVSLHHPTHLHSFLSSRSVWAASSSLLLASCPPFILSTHRQKTPQACSALLPTEQTTQPHTLGNGRPPAPQRQAGALLVCGASRDLHALPARLVRASLDKCEHRTFSQHSTGLRSLQHVPRIKAAQQKRCPRACSIHQ